MARPSRHASPEAIPITARTLLPIDVLRSYPRAGKFRLHDFLVVPAHVHLLMTGFGTRQQGLKPCDGPSFGTAKAMP
jgi:hypothetical protein